MRVGPALLGMIAGIVIMGGGGREAPAQVPWDWALHGGSSQADFNALHPLIQDMLKNDDVGASRRWRSPSGRHGRIYLESGGDKAHAASAVVRITTRAHRRETPFFTFRYRKDAVKGWAVVG